MPFLAAIPAIIGAASIGGAASVGSALIAKSGGGSSKDLIKQQTKNAAFAQEQGAENVKAGRDALQLPLDYYKTLLSGDRNALLTAAAPDVNTVVSQYDSALKQANEFGGLDPTQAAELRFKKAGDITNLLLGKRKEGAQGTERIGGTLLGAGNSELGIASGATGSALQAQATRDAAGSQASGEIGAGIGSIIAALILRRGNQEDSTKG